MTYCGGIMTREGLVMASDCRTNASYDQVNVCRKMHTFIDPGERVFILLTSGSLSCSQSIMTLLRRDFDQGTGLATVSSMYDAARAVGDQVRRVSKIDRQALEQDRYSFNVHILLAGQIRDQQMAQLQQAKELAEMRAAMAEMQNELQRRRGGRPPSKDTDAA